MRNNRKKNKTKQKTKQRRKNRYGVEKANKRSRGDEGKEEPQASEEAPATVETSKPEPAPTVTKSPEELQQIMDNLHVQLPDADEVKLKNLCSPNPKKVHKVILNIMARVKGEKSVDNDEKKTSYKLLRKLVKSDFLKTPLALKSIDRASLQFHFNILNDIKFKPAEEKIEKIKTFESDNITLSFKIPSDVKKQFNTKFGEELDLEVSDYQQATENIKTEMVSLDTSKLSANLCELANWKQQVFSFVIKDLEPQLTNIKGELSKKEGSIVALCLHYAQLIINSVKEAQDLPKSNKDIVKNWIMDIPIDTEEVRNFKSNHNIFTSDNFRGPQISNRNRKEFKIEFGDVVNRNKHEFMEQLDKLLKENEKLDSETRSGVLFNTAARWRKESYDYTVTSLRDQLKRAGKMKEIECRYIAQHLHQTVLTMKNIQQVMWSKRI